MPGTTVPFTSQRIDVISDFPAWDNVPAGKQNLALEVGEWGSSEAAPENTYLLVHGITANLQWWNSFARNLIAASSEPVRVIAPDLRGRGDSDKPEGPYSLIVNAADMVGLLDALEIKQPINYVGHSLGAHIGSIFASSYPERLRKLVLIDGGARLASDAGLAVAPALARLGKIYHDFIAYTAPLKAANIIPDWDADVNNIYHYDIQTVDGGVVSKVSKDAIDQELSHLASYSNMVESLYPQIKVPTVIIWAPNPISPAQNPFLLPEVREIMQSKIAGSTKVVEVPGTNHYTVQLKPSVEMITAILE